MAAFEPASWVVEAQAKLEDALALAKTLGVVVAFTVQGGDPDRGPDIKIVYRPALSVADLDVSVRTVLP